MFTDTDGVFSGLMFQDNLMKSIFSSYPEVLIDATYKLTDLRMPVYLMMCIEEKGEGEIVLVLLKAVETQEESIAKMVQAFKKFNPCWTHMNVVISDKDFNEQAVFRKEFPGAALHISLFHTL